MNDICSALADFQFPIRKTTRKLKMRVQSITLSITSPGLKPPPGCFFSSSVISHLLPRLVLLIRFCVIRWWILHPPTNIQICSSDDAYSFLYLPAPQFLPD